MFVLLRSYCRSRAGTQAVRRVAFALDAWWENRTERAHMVDALEAVAMEVERNLQIVDSASDEINRLFMGLLGVDRQLDPGGPGTPGAMRESLGALADDEAARTAIYTRTFFLTYLYAEELAATKTRLEELHGHLARALAEG